MSPTLPLRPLRALAGPALAGLALFLLAASARAQTGTLAGVVVDGETGETLIGVNVVVEPLGAGAATGLDGDYRIAGLVPGTYDVAFSYLGYTPQRVTGVEVAAGETARLDVQLAPEALEIEGGEVIVEATALLDNEAGLLRQRQRAAAVSDAISAEAISRSGASTAGDALQKVTGASVVGGRYVYVRGLGDRYVNTQLNGATLPSSDPDRNAVPLDLFPSGLLDNIVTSKTFTADQPGSFTGGNVNINTQAFPDRLAFEFSASTGYNAEASLRDDFLTTNRGGSDWLGFDDGTRDIPAMWTQPGTRVPSISSARTNPDSAAALDRLARAFNPTMAPGVGEAPINRSFSASLGNQVQLLGRPLGFLGSLSYSRDFSAYRGGTTAQYQLTGRVAETDSLTTNLLLDDSRGTEEALWGGLATAAYRLHPNHNLSGSVLYNRSGIAESRYQVGLYPKNFNATDRFFETRTVGWTERDLSTAQLRGEHAFPNLRGLRADWTASYARTRQDEPDLRFFANDFTVRDNGEASADTFYAITFSNYGKPARYFRNLDEGTWNNALNLALPFGGRRWAGTLKVGGAVALTERELRERRFEYTTNASAYRYDGDPDAFFTGGTGVVDTTASGRFVIGNYLLDATTPTNNYDGSQDVYAAYAMAEFRPMSRLRAIVGARFEATRQAVANRDTTGRIREDDWLPSLSLVYEVTGNMNVRAAYGRTLARPSLREFSPAVTFEYVGGYLFLGNPQLERTLVDNFDLRWEWFMRPGELLAVSGFYKRFQNPIERAFVGINDQIQFQNVDEATVVGAEFEARRRFDRLPFAGLIEAGANLTLAHSTVRIPAFELAILRDLDPNASDTRPLQGQSPFVGNFDVTYRHDAAGTALSVLYNAFGRRLASVSLGGTPNDFEYATGTLDVTFRQDLGRGLRLRASAKNVLGDDARFGHTYKGADYVTRAYERGRTFSVGVSYRFD